VIQAQIRAQIEASIAIKQALLVDSALLGQVQRLAENCLASLNAVGKIIFAGNGGSFSDAQHLSAEFTTLFLFDRAPLASIVLAANNSAISVIGNDYGYEQVFARKLQAMAKPGDVFIPISTSGNSANILKSVQVAKQQNITTVGFTGKSARKLLVVCECICIPSADTARIQECHIMVGHILCGLVESAYFKS
jgi:D-sedoheptulose 7-phosphate isomerase